MNVLGINGLGVLPSAGIVSNGKLLAFAEEERFTRLKGSFGFMPGAATDFCLKQAGLSLEKIDAIAFGWNSNLYRFEMPLFSFWKYLTRSPKIQKTGNMVSFTAELLKYHPKHVKSKIDEMLGNYAGYNKRIPVHFVSHHHAHAATAFYLSGFDSSYILVIDGSGEKNCTSIFKGTGQEIKHIESINIPDSLGWFYQSITEFLGFSPNHHEGKLMGLAAYGAYDKAIFDKMEKIIHYQQGASYRYNASFGFLGNHTTGKVYSNQLVSLLGEPRSSDSPISNYHKNIAFAAQKKLEEIVVGIVRYIAKRSDFNGNLCIAGGVALNCKMNGVLLELPEIERLYIPSVPSDAGVSLGAALAVSKAKAQPVSQTTEHAYWGPEYSDSEIENTLNKFGLNYSSCQQIESIVAELLSQGKIVGWFQGRMEAGSRALGARSILASPLDASMKDIINLKVKGRENWRPFAASILYEERERFVFAKDNAPFMAVAFRVKPEALKMIPAAVHIDGTTRPQFVKKEINEKYWNLISKFSEITGVPAVLNTSFNTKEEPIVENPSQAIKAFYGSGMDCLAIGNYLLQK
ncbi:MAG TPA: carbamoyltransferase C-terminal domain-containing protein [Bacteroidales bacterium]|nr:carbamoyltransferase C-terminal domain-containing protein [Bacteroidales bacterium]